MWNATTDEEKEPYIKMAAQDSERYKQEKQQYEEKLCSEDVGAKVDEQKQKESSQSPNKSSSARQRMQHGLRTVQAEYGVEGRIEGGDLAVEQTKSRRKRHVPSREAATKPHSEAKSSKRKRTRK